ncbi:Abi family protein [Hyphomonas oceanitis]|uniref:Abi-like family protein n=1 Tax=Hyphomonas oceanitis SCH89 TaxID=1280953 RepID=A0A059G7M4_9PROT|nr:Abi family protein [Hyphomonas oceanitis]KDA02734.1 Abi-like family protein [Hyphomonas oceanitis SCH89]
MDYSKPATNINDQATLLKQRGMVIVDEDLVKRWLVTVGYYRLSAYWLPYEKPAQDNQTRSKVFFPGTPFESVVDIYTFDRQLRLLVTEAIERVEIALRTSWTYHLSHASGPHAHMNAEFFDSGWSHAKRIATMAARTEQSREVFITHYQEKYGNPYMPPLWAVTELMTFGELSKWISATSNLKISSAIAKDIGLPSRETLEGAIQTLAYVRNICAHHGRLWNRRLVKRIPNIKRFRDDLCISQNGRQAQPENHIYNVLVILMRLLNHQSPDTTFSTRLKELIQTREPVQRKAMGFPDDWESRPIWKTA